MIGLLPEIRAWSWASFLLLLTCNLDTGDAARVRHTKFNCTQETGTFPDPYSCESYWICQYGNPIAASCNFGLIFSHKLLNCDWAKPEICTVIDGKIVRDWVPPTPAPEAKLDEMGNVVTESPGYTQAMKSDFSSVTTSSISGSLNGTSGQLVTRKVVQLQWNVTKPGQHAPNLSAYQQLLAKWRFSQKRLKSLENTALKSRSTTTMRPGLTGPMGFILPDSVTKAPRNLYTVQPIGDQAIPCDKKKCRLPNCYCDASSIPGGLSAEQTPQIVMVTFDDAVNGGNIDLMNHLFQINRTNPNGCPITGTFFLANQWTDYNDVRDLYKRGHEISSHSLSHKDFSSYDKHQWRNEIVGEAEVAHEYAGVNISDIVGMRAPFLAVGGDTMFRMLWENGFLYDSSIPSSQTMPPLWPYTFDSPMPHKCWMDPCPKGYWPGLWEVPMTYFVGLNEMGCSMYDACTHPSDEDDIADLFYANFMKHYSTNRAPYLLSAHSAWYENSEPHENAMQSFMDRALKLGDVYFVTVKQAIAWMQTPTPLSQIQDFQPWQCAKSSQDSTTSTASSKKA